MSIIKIVDTVSGELNEYEHCQSCGGVGGEDHSTDPEVYDDWQDCIDCEGRGYVDIGYFDRETFVPKRDAFQAGE